MNEFYYLYTHRNNRTIVKSPKDIHKNEIGSIRVKPIYSNNDDPLESFTAYDLEGYILLTPEEIVTGKLTEWKNFG